MLGIMVNLISQNIKILTLKFTHLVQEQKGLVMTNKNNQEMDGHKIKDRLPLLTKVGLHHKKMFDPQHKIKDGLTLQTKVKTLTLDQMNHSRNIRSGDKDNSEVLTYHKTQKQSKHQMKIKMFFRNELEPPLKRRKFKFSNLI